MGLLVNLLTICILAFDVFIQFNISFYQRGKLITSRGTIMKKYIKFQFWIDIGSIFLLLIYIVGGNHELIYLKILFYFKITSLIKIDSSILHRLEMSRLIYAIYRLLRLFLYLWFLTTWIAAIFFSIDFYFYNEKGYYYQKNQLWLTNSEAVGNLEII